jgi:hypothetical protein
VGEGDIVTTLFTPGGSYKIKAVKDDEILDCENLVTGTCLGLRATSVEVYAPDWGMDGKSVEPPSWGAGE